MKKRILMLDTVQASATASAVQTISESVIVLVFTLKEFKAKLSKEKFDKIIIEPHAVTYSQEAVEELKEAIKEKEVVIFSTQDRELLLNPFKIDVRIYRAYIQKGRPGSISELISLINS